ncbi:MAG: hypothetical protein HFG00_11605, partial [Oscillibacter sp.]|nr:hypothetical protein [Oscillibacter sp.]
MKDGVREPARLVFKDFVQHGIERNDQKGLQRLINQIKPLHLTENMEGLVLTVRRDQKGPDGLINGRNECKGTQGGPQPPVKVLKLQQFLSHKLMIAAVSFKHSPHLPSHPGHESSEANRGRKRRNSHHSAVFGEAGNGTAAGNSKYSPHLPSHPGHESS